MESDSESTEAPQITKTYYEDDGDPLFQMQNDPHLKIGDIVELGTNNQAARRLLRVTGCTGYTYDDIMPDEWQGGRRRTNKKRRTNRKKEERLEKEQENK
jgi:hypothetical protein